MIAQIISIFCILFILGCLLFMRHNYEKTIRSLDATIIHLRNELDLKNKSLEISHDAHASAVTDLRGNKRLVEHMEIRYLSLKDSIDHKEKVLEDKPTNGRLLMLGGNA